MHLRNASDRPEYVRHYCALDLGEPPCLRTALARYWLRRCQPQCTRFEKRE